MSDPKDKYQQNIVPEEFQERLTEMGGVNRYDEPNFLMIWGQGGGDYSKYRAGGDWAIEGQPSFHGYRDLLLGGGTPSWCLLQWEDAIIYGTPEMYYVMNYDHENDLQTVGEYPYSGRYRVLYNLRWSGMVNGSLQVESMPLNSYLLETVLPIIVHTAKDISWEKTQAAMKDIKEREDAAKLSMIEDCMRSSSLAFKGPVSYTKQGCRTSLIDRKMEQMQRHWNAMIKRADYLGKGLSTHEDVPTWMNI